MAVIQPDTADGPSFPCMVVQDGVDEWALMASAHGTGVVTGCQVTPGVGMSVNVAAGVVLIQGQVYLFAGVSNLAVGAANSGDRRDCVVLRMAGGVVSAVEVPGTPSTYTLGNWTTAVDPGVYQAPLKPFVNWISANNSPGFVNVSTDCPLQEVVVGSTNGPNTTTSISSTTPTGTPAGNLVDKRPVVANFVPWIRHNVWQDATERGGSTAATAVADGQINGTTKTAIIDVVGGDSTAGSVDATLGVTDWVTDLANMENRKAGLVDPGPGLVLCNGPGGLAWSSTSTSGAFGVVAARTVASVTLGATATVTATSFPGVAPGQVVTVSSGTGTLTAGTYVVSVSGTNCVLNQAPATTGTATLSFDTTPIQGPSVIGQRTSWNLATTGNAIGDGVTSTGGAITGAFSTIAGTNVLYSTGAVSNIRNGMLIVGPGIGPNTRVELNVGNGVVYMTSNAIATVSAVTMTFSLTFRRVQIYYQLQNKGDKVTFQPYGPAGALGAGSGAQVTDNAAGGIGMWDSGDLGTSALLGGGGITATWTSGGGGAGAIVIGARYFNSAGTSGVVVDNLAWPGTTAATWAADTTGSGAYDTWAAWIQNLVQAGTPPRRFYFIAGINDATGNAAGYSTYQTNLQNVANTVKAISPTTEVVIVGQWYGDAVGAQAALTTVSGWNYATFPSGSGGLAGEAIAGAGIPSGTTLVGTAGSAGAQTVASCVLSSSGPNPNEVTTTTNIAVQVFAAQIAPGMVVTGGSGIPANTIVTAISFSSPTWTITLSNNVTVNTTETLTFTPTMELSNNATASATVPVTLYWSKGGPVNWQNWSNAAQAASYLTGSTFVNLFESIGDVSPVSAVTGVTLTAGSVNASVASGGFPGVVTGQAIGGSGTNTLGAIPLGCTVANVSGNNLTLSAPANGTTTAYSTSGVTNVSSAVGVLTFASTAGITVGMTVTGANITGSAQILAMTATQVIIHGTIGTLVSGSFTFAANLLFGADMDQVSGQGLHMGDKFNTQSGRDGHRDVAEHIRQKLRFSQHQPPVQPFNSWMTVNAPGATPSINTDATSLVSFTGVGTAITSMSSALTGSPITGQMLTLSFLDNGTARAITWGSELRGWPRCAPADLHDQEPDLYGPVRVERVGVRVPVGMADSADLHPVGRGGDCHPEHLHGGQHLRGRYLRNHLVDHQRLRWPGGGGPGSGRGNGRDSYVGQLPGRQRDRPARCHPGPGGQHLLRGAVPLQRGGRGVAGDRGMVRQPVHQRRHARC
jgi:hypothetical protein